MIHETHTGIATQKRGCPFHRFDPPTTPTDWSADALEARDALVVTKPDRLARSTLDPLRIIDLIGKEGAGFKSLGDPWADTTTPHGRLMLTVLSGIAELERDLILQRTNEGRARAMAEGTRFGRKPKLSKHQAREAVERVAAGERRRTTALSYAVDHSTISRLKALHAAEL
jgi:DNA invertase Pin-like site-specific DNA recombinase